MICFIMVFADSNVSDQSELEVTTVMLTNVQSLCPNSTGCPLAVLDSLINTKTNLLSSGDSPVEPTDQ